MSSKLNLGQGERVSARVKNQDCLGFFYKHFFIISFLLIQFNALAQPGSMSNNTDCNGTYSNKAMTTVGTGSNNTVFTYREQANATTSSGTKYYQFNSDSYSNAWNLNTPTYNSVTPAVWNGGCGGCSYNGNNRMGATTNGNYYTFNIRKGSGYTNQSMAILETAYNPRDISSYTTPSAFGQQTPTMTVTLSNILQTNEFLYVAYSTDAFATSGNSGILSVTSSAGSVYTFTFPAYTSGTTVTFYPFTSVSNSAPSFINAPLLTLNMRSSTGQNNTGTYSTYIVQAWTTTTNGDWNSASTWTANATPSTSQNLGTININHNVTGNADAIFSALNINGSSTLTLNSSNTHQTSGAITINSTATYTVNGTIRINSGGFISGKSPSYSPTSTLAYNAGGGSSSKYNQSLEWPESNSPSNIIIDNNTWVQLQGNRSLTGNLTVTNGALQGTGGAARVLTMSSSGSQTITVSTSTGGAIYGTDNGLNNDLTLTIASGSTTTFTGDATTSNDDEKKFVGVTINSGGTLILQRGILVKYGAFNVNGILQINSNGYIQGANINGKAASYGSSGVLVYNNGGTYTSTNYEWPATAQNVTIQNSGTNITLNGSKTVNGTLTINSGTTLQSNSISNLSKLVFSPGSTITSTISYAGGADLEITSSGNTSDAIWPASGGPTDVIINASGSTINLHADRTVTGTLTLTSGKLSTGSNTLYLSNSSTNSISGGSSSSYIIGNLKRAVAGTGTYVFPIGIASNYLEASINFTNGYTSADLTASYVAGNVLSINSGLTSNGQSLIGAVGGGFWTITEGAGAVGSPQYNITLQKTDYTASQGNSNVYTIIKRVTGSGDNSWTVQGTHQANSSPFSGSTITSTRNGLSTFSDFTIAYAGSALPVTFTSLTGNIRNGRANLSWTIADEHNVDHYEVEESVNGRQFLALTQVDAANRNSYQATDAQLYSGTNYYRVKAVDIDGKLTYSKIIRLENNALDQQIRVYPNPSQGEINLSLNIPAGNYQIRMINALGQTVHQQSLTHEGGSRSMPLALPKLNAGIYQVEVRGGVQKYVRSVRME